MTLNNAHVTSIEEIGENEFNLNIPRYHVMLTLLKKKLQFMWFWTSKNSLKKLYLKNRPLIGLQIKLLKKI